MFHFICDRCEKGLLLGEDVRYEMTVEIKSAYDPMEITGEDLKKDFNDEILELLNKMKHKTQEELEDQVYKLFKFDLCMECQKRILKDPLLREGYKGYNSYKGYQEQP
ncbi:MAG: hypothetical protein AB1599_00810 [Planctomycetota bacterium]